MKKTWTNEQINWARGLIRCVWADADDSRSMTGPESEQLDADYHSVREDPRLGFSAFDKACEIAGIEVDWRSTANWRIRTEMVQDALDAATEDTPKPVSIDTVRRFERSRGPTPAEDYWFDRDSGRRYRSREAVMRSVRRRGHEMAIEQKCTVWVTLEWVEWLVGGRQVTRSEHKMYKP